MFTNYIKTALRNFNSNRSITLIKIIGLSLGMAVTFFILLYVNLETSYDDQHVNRKRIFRVNQYNHIHSWKTRSTPYPMQPELESSFPEIEYATRVIRLNNVVVYKNDQFINEFDFICVDNSFFQIFTLKTTQGSTSNFNSNSQNVIISESAALKYFGSNDVVNNQLKIECSGEEFLLNIIAVFEDFPYSSTIKADFISTTEFGLNQIDNQMFWSDGEKRPPEFYRDSWETNVLETYILLNKPEDAKGFDLKFKELEKKHLSDTTERDYYIQNLKDIYLHSDDMIGGGPKINLNSIYIFSIIAFLVLFIACINYIILSTSQILSRTKEIGIRKIAGARKKDLFKQILIESLLVVLVTLPLSWILIEQLRPFLMEVLEKELVLIYNWKLAVGFIFIIVFAIFLPGLYILNYLNKISPITILQKDRYRGTNRFDFKKGLIIVQFIIFIVLVVISLGIRKQINFSKRDLGFNVDNKLVVSIGDIASQDKYSTLKEELLRNPKVSSVSGAMWLPPSNGRMSVSLTDTSYGQEPFKVEGLFVDKDFIETFGIKMIEGETFKNYDNAEWKIILNQKAQKLLNNNDLIGRDIWAGKIVGIAEDFRFHSSHEKIGPMLLIVNEGNVREMVVSYKEPVTTSNIKELKKEINSVIENFNNDPVFLEDRFQFLYKEEYKQAHLVSIFSIVAIFIASIGLLGLTIFSTKNQTKNIAIRKVNGASTFSILRLLLSGYVKLIIISMIIASPFAFFLLKKWLQGFEYRTNIDWWLFIVAGAVALVISLATISWYSIKAARKNPVESLRYE